MTTLSDKLLAISTGELIEKNEHLAKLYPNKLYQQWANVQREKYYKLTGRQYKNDK